MGAPTLSSRPSIAPRSRAARSVVSFRGLGCREDPQTPGDAAPIPEFPVQADALGAKCSRLVVALLNDAQQREVEQRDPHRPLLSLPARPARAPPREAARRDRNHPRASPDTRGRRRPSPVSTEWCSHAPLSGLRQRVERTRRRRRAPAPRARRRRARTRRRRGLPRCGRARHFLPTSACVRSKSPWKNVMTPRHMSVLARSAGVASRPTDSARSNHSCPSRK